jgi:hypothetical protein
VHSHHQVEVLFGHAGEHLVPHDAGVVDDGVESTEPLYRLLDERSGAVEVGDRRGVGERCTAPGDDLLDHHVGGRGGLLLAMEAGADVIHDHRGAMARQLEAVRPAEAPAAARHDHDPPIEEAHRHPPNGDPADRPRPRPRMDVDCCHRYMAHLR